MSHCWIFTFFKISEKYVYTAFFPCSAKLHRTLTPKPKYLPDHWCFCIAALLIDTWTGLLRNLYDSLHMFGLKNMQTVAWSGSYQTSSCHSQAVSKHTVAPIIPSSLSSEGKEGEECVCMCVYWGDCRNNICGFRLAPRWLNDDMGPFLLLGRVTF